MPKASIEETVDLQRNNDILWKFSNLKLIGFEYSIIHKFENMLKQIWNKNVRVIAKTARFWQKRNKKDNSGITLCATGAKLESVFWIVSLN